MNAQETVSDYERRAHACNLSIDELCRRAEINRATWQRWKSGASSPTFRKMNAVDGVLNEVEGATADS